MASAEECQKVCAANGACKYFTFDKHAKVCYLKKAKGRIFRHKLNLISGPSECYKGKLKVKYILKS